MNKRLMAGVFVLATVFVVGATTTMAADTNVGAWKLNLAKSQYNPGPAPTSQALKIEAWGSDGVKYSSDGTDAAGKPAHSEFQAKYDEKLVPFKGNPDADMISYKRIDANTIDSTTQLNGKVTVRTRAVVSADGKTRTLTQTGVNAKGQAVHNVLVFDKQ
jgi:hypothetical protein